MLHQIQLRARMAAVVALLAFTFASVPPICNGADNRLQMEAHPDRLDFILEGASNSAPWVLQHSSDQENWSDLLFFDEVVIGGGPPRVSIPRGGLPETNGGSDFFQARELNDDDPKLREYLAARLRWRLSGIDTYQYDIERPNQIYWLGRITVTGGKVSHHETLDLHPPFAGAPSVPTIDDLFDRIATAIANEAALIDVTWDPVYGFPVEVMIDPFAEIADEEDRWIIKSFTPYTPPSSSPIGFSAAAAGNYSGFLRPTDGSGLSGYFQSIKFRSGGLFSAKVYFGTRAYTIKGRFGENGAFSKVIKLKRGAAATVKLQLVETGAGAYKVEGTIKVDDQSAEVVLVKSGDTKDYAGRYTLLIPSEEDESTAPQGYGHGVMSVSSKGSAKIMGRLGDGRKWTAKCLVTNDGEMPLYSDLYTSRRGSLGGLIRFRNVAGVSDCDGEVEWFKHKKFNLQRNLIGSRYNLQQVIAGDLETKPDLIADVGAGSGFEAATNILGWTKYKKKKADYSGPGKVKLTLSAKTGSISGYIPQDGTKFKAAGVVFQKQDLAAGMVTAKGKQPRSLVVVPLD